MKKTAFDFVESLDLSGKVYIVTGAYAGLGAVTTQALVKAGATVILAGRNKRAQAEFVQQFLQPSQLDGSHTLELGDLQSVKSFADYVLSNYTQIDCLINNAGVMFTPPGKTKDGFETQFGVNVIGHFLLAKLLVEKTKRQVWLSSRGHIRLGAPRIDLEAVTKVDASNYNTRFRYQQSKLGDILLAKYFNQQYAHLTAVSVHPGVVKTNLARHMSLGKKMALVLRHPLAIMSMKAPEEGAATQVMVATMADAELVGGAYYADCKVTQEAESAQNMEDAKLLFEYCDEVTKAFQA